SIAPARTVTWTTGTRATGRPLSATGTAVRRSGIADRNRGGVMTRAIVSGLLACAAACVVSTSVDLGVVEAQGAGGGTITGKVKLDGPSPGNPIIRMGMDPMCGKLNAGKKPINEIVARSEDGGLANTFIDLEGKFAASPAPSAAVELDQRNC